MHLLIIILQQLLGLLPNGEGKKAPQVELARVPRPNPHGSDARGSDPRGSDLGAFLGFESRRHDWMTHYWSRGPQGVRGANLRAVESGIPAVEWVYAQFKRRLRPAPRNGRPPGADEPDAGA
jgi:hypothetical protein